MILKKGLSVWGISFALFAMSSVALGTVGCEQRALVTATVNTTKLLQYDDEYQRLSQEYFKARVEMANKLREKLKETGGVIKDQAVFDKYTKAEADLNAEWLKITREYTEKKMAVIRNSCEKMRETKGIDLFVLDSAEQPSVEYGAVDVTSDIMVDMSSFAGEGGEAKADDDKLESKASTSPSASPVTSSPAQ